MEKQEPSHCVCSAAVFLEKRKEKMMIMYVIHIDHLQQEQSETENWLPLGTNAGWTGVDGRLDTYSLVPFEFCVM